MRSLRRGFSAKRLAARCGRAACYLAFILLLLLSATLGYGIPSADVNRLDDFVEATNRWTSTNDFRTICHEYVHFSHEAMRIRIAGVSAVRCIMVLRKTPGLPEWLSVNETSQRHYDSFARGELSAYLHLAGEQGTDLFIGQFESMARQQTLPDEQIRRFLDSFHLSAPVSNDTAAIESVQKLLADTDAARAFEIRVKTDAALLLPHIQSLAGSLALPDDLNQMSPEQQRRVFDALDTDIAGANPALWRTKQVNDFLAGVWGQAYAQIYRDYAIGPLLMLHRTGRWTTWILLAVVGYGLWRKTRQRGISRASGETTSNPRPSSGEGGSTSTGEST